MVPNLVSHVKSELDKKIKAILSNSYIINEVLKELEDDVAKNFITKYAGTFDSSGKLIKDGIGISILSNYPENFLGNSTFVLVGMGDGSESDGSLGVSSSGYTTNNTEIVKDRNLVISYDKAIKKPYIITTYLAYLPSIVVPSMSGVTLERLDDTNKLYLNNLPEEVRRVIEYDESTIRVNYTKQTAPDNSTSPGNSYGFMVEESASVLIVSDNLDDIRAVDSIIKASLILMRKSDDEFEKYNIGKSSYSAPVPLQDIAPSEPKIIFGREILLTYTVDYYLDNINQQKLRSVLVAGIH